MIQSTEFWLSDSANVKVDEERVIKFNVLLTSYDIMLIDGAILNNVTWEVLVVDEGHRLKNRKSKLYDVMQPLTTKFRMLMTGTPIQNELEELFNMTKQSMQFR